MVRGKKGGQFLQVRIRVGVLMRVVLDLWRIFCWKICSPSGVSVLASGVGNSSRVTYHLRAGLHDQCAATFGVVLILSADKIALSLRAGFGKGGDSGDMRSATLLTRADADSAAG
jgi:hypothetical protein